MSGNNGSPVKHDTAAGVEAPAAFSAQHSPADATPVIIQSIDDLFEVAVANRGDGTVTVGSTGYAAYEIGRAHV